MKKLAFIFLMVLLFQSCFHRTAMTQLTFTQIEPGMSIVDLEKSYGKPYHIYSRDGQSDIYEYIERIMIGPEVVEQRSYYFIVSQKKVVGKYMKYSTPPAYQEIYTDDAFPNY